jgi:hypothetical protein
MLFCGLLLCLAASSRAQAPEPIAIWYRSGGSCPDGEAFLRSLESRAVRARLAQVGDAIDFVVTLGPGQAATHSGVIERQTDTGTVAIRRVDDPDCDQVAAALSLTLALAAQQPKKASGVESGPERLPVAVPSPDRPKVVPVSAPIAKTAAPEGPPLRLSIGMAGSAATGIAPALLLGLAPFIELEWGLGILRPALRLAPFAAFGSGTRAGRAIDTRLLGARIAACPIELSPGSLALRPCLALELGELRSEGEGITGRSDSGVWLASEAAARVTWPRDGTAALEAEVGLALPWTRYTLQSGDTPPAAMHQTAALSVSARIGLVVHFP